jgi:hypothetical protein
MAESAAKSVKSNSIKLNIDIFKVCKNVMASISEC